MLPFAYGRALDTRIFRAGPLMPALAGMAIKRKTGARGLRAIIEHLMLDVMYETPMRNDITRLVITRDMVEHGLHPLAGIEVIETETEEQKKSA